jgi:hypothetical protein
MREQESEIANDNEMGIKGEDSKCPCLIVCLVSRVWCWSSIPTQQTDAIG